MPRAAKGPRRIDQTGTWYAVKVIRGVRKTISLQTKIKSEALRRWPAAQARLEELAEPLRLPRGGQTLITEWDPETGLSEQVWEWNENLVRDEYLYDEEDSSLISWAKAEEIAARRYLRRRGREVSRSWRYQILNAKRHLNVKYPLDTKPKDIREMINGMESQDYKASTIAQRCSALSGLIDALIKGGYTDDDFSNPFERVDTAGVSTKSFYKAKPEDYQWVSKVIANDQSNKQQITTLLVLINTGARISEIVKGTYQDGWLLIKEGKNKASVRSVPLPDSLSLCRQEDIATSIDSFRRWFNKQRPHVMLTPHSFRHGFKSAARVAQADEITVERLLGHTIPKMALIYGEFPRDVLRREAVKVQAVIEDWTVASLRQDQ